MSTRTCLYSAALIPWVSLLSSALIAFAVTPVAALWKDYHVATGLSTTLPSSRCWLAGPPWSKHPLSACWQRCLAVKLQPSRWQTRRRPLEAARTPSWCWCVSLCGVRVVQKPSSSVHFAHFLRSRVAFSATTPANLYGELVQFLANQKTCSISEVCRLLIHLDNEDYRIPAQLHRSPSDTGNIHRTLLL